MGTRRRPGILPVIHLDPQVREAMTPLVEIAGRVTGVTLPKVRPLSATSNNADIIAKINEIISRLQED